MSSIIGIYFFYGQGLHPSNLQIKTRLHLADPEGERHAMGDHERAWVIINHYLGVLSRVGLWGHRNFLATCLQEAARRKVPQTQFREIDEMLPAEAVYAPLAFREQWVDFVGNGYNTLIAQARATAEKDPVTQITQREIQGQLDAGFLVSRHT